jgi:CDP-diacylglycerol--glycerol-3-phosphate 3-phosphatidyltransferase
MHNLATLLTVSRLVAAPFLLAAAWADARATFLILLGWGLVSDALDGPVARAFHSVSARGAMLDSVSDVVFYVTAVGGVLRLYPTIVERAPWLPWVFGAAWGAPIVLGLIKFRRLTSYHTVLARSSLVALLASFLVFLISDWAGLFPAAAMLFVFSAIDEMLITALLDAHRSDVPHCLSLLPRRNRSRRFIHT